jgi:hypothetical protein
MEKNVNQSISSNPVDILLSTLQILKGVGYEKKIYVAAGYGFFCLVGLWRRR